MPPRLDTRTLRSHALGALVLAAVILAAPVGAHAAPPTGAAAAADVGRLEAECARLRAELDRVNADVAQLKQGDRGVRSDYRLRQRMADAEALARKLTDAEAQLRARKGTAPPASPPSLAPPPAASSGDGPIELEAKADLLADQARRLASEAEGLSRAAGQLRSRQTLRRRANQLERDPFVGLDAASKRLMVFGGPRQAGTGNKEGAGGTVVANPPGQGGMATAGDSRAGGPAPTAPPGNTPPPATQPTNGFAPPATTAPPGQPTTAILTPVRTFLDPITLAEVQRLERSGKPLADAEALEKAAAALRARAQALEAQSKTLRAKAK